MAWLNPCDKHKKEGYTMVLEGNFCYECNQRNDPIEDNSKC